MDTPPSRNLSTRSSKYDGVKGTVDSGKSVTALKRVQDSKNFVKKKDELFKRIRTKALAHFIEEEGWATLGNSKEEGGSGGVHNLLSPPSTSNGEKKPEVMRSYVLLDVRLSEDFEKSSIIGAMSYPSAMLSRATNEFTKEIHALKNKENKLIIIYDADESIAAKAATLMFQKGIDNIFLLSGGLIDMAEKFPEFVQGTPPVKQGTPKLKNKTDSRPNSTSSTASFVSTTSGKSVVSTSMRSATGGSTISRGGSTTSKKTTTGVRSAKSQAVLKAHLAKKNLTQNLSQIG